MFKEINKIINDEIIASLVGHLNIDKQEDTFFNYFIENNGLSEDKLKELLNKIPEQNVSIIMNVDVLKDYRGRGFATEMIKDFISCSNCSVILIADVTYKDSRDFLIDFYEKLGFETIGHVGFQPIMIKI